MFEDNQDFYPTPAPLALRMIAKLEATRAGRYNRDRWLEPSAGRGDLVEAIIRQYDHRHYSIKVDCIESDPDLSATLKGKDFLVIHDDFLTYSGKTQYDVILMNPPFSRGAEHVLQAWDVLYDGEVVAIVNAETIRNPHTQARKNLVNRIELNGTVEFITQAFRNADRRTEVEIALIHLTKKGDVKHDFFKGMEDGGNHQPSEETSDGQLAVAGRSIENIVTSYERAVETGIEAIIKGSEAGYYRGLLGGLGGEDEERTRNVKLEINSLIGELKSKGWEYVVHSTDFSSVTTSKVRQKIMNDLDVLKRTEFTASNIRQFLINLIEDQPGIIAECVDEVFDEFTKYHEENRVHIEGWKSNDYFFVGRRVVLPYIFELGFHGGLDMRYSAQEKLMDIDRAMAHVDGKRSAKVGIVEAIKAAGDIWGEKIESTYFEIRGYKKGTMHLRFKDKTLLDRFNLIAGRRKGWLPEADADVPKEFWLINSK